MAAAPTTRSTWFCFTIPVAPRRGACTSGKRRVIRTGASITIRQDTSRAGLSGVSVFACFQSCSRADVAFTRDRPEDCLMAHKVCTVVPRISNGVAEILAFRHPSAGKQFVKGSIEEGRLRPSLQFGSLRRRAALPVFPTSSI